jgi:hypothetical protein
LKLFLESIKSNVLYITFLFFVILSTSELARISGGTILREDEETAGSLI